LHLIVYKKKKFTYIQKRLRPTETTLFPNRMPFGSGRSDKNFFSYAVNQVKKHGFEIIAFKVLKGSNRIEKGSLKGLTWFILLLGNPWTVEQLFRIHHLFLAQFLGMQTSFTRVCQGMTIGVIDAFFVNLLTVIVKIHSDTDSHEF